MLTVDKVARPNNLFKFMMIDQWSPDTNYNNWDVRRDYTPSRIYDELYYYTQYLSVCQTLKYHISFPILMASYDLGFEQDYSLFNRTYSYFQLRAKNESVRLDAMKYLKRLMDQLTGSNYNRTKTLNEFFVSDDNLLILDKTALEMVIKNEKIKDIVIIGKAWESCLRIRPVGFNNLDLSTCNYYIIPKLCYKLNGTNVEESDLESCTQTKWSLCDSDVTYNNDIDKEHIDIYKLIEIIK
jgi:hypothetical protein